MVSSGITFVLNFVEIRRLVEEWKGETYRQTDIKHGDITSLLFP
jgi:hypothetical protein